MGYTFASVYKHSDSIDRSRGLDLNALAKAFAFCPEREDRSHQDAFEEQVGG